MIHRNRFLIIKIFGDSSKITIKTDANFVFSLVDNDGLISNVRDFLIFSKLTFLCKINY